MPLIDYSRSNPAHAAALESEVAALASGDHRQGTPGTLNPGRKLDLHSINYLADLLTQKYPEANRRLETLHLRQQNITDEGVPALCEIIRNAVNLRNIDLGSNLMTADGMSRICEAIGKNSSIRVVDMARNPIGKNGGADLIAMVKAMPQLVRLDVEQTEISGETVKRLLEVAEKHPSLSRLSMSHNFTTSQEATEVSPLISRNKNLVLLNLSSTHPAIDQILNHAFACCTSKRLLFCTNNEPDCMRKNKKRAATLYRQCKDGVSQLTGPQLLEVESDYRAIFKDAPFGPQLREGREKTRMEYDQLLASLPSLPAMDAGFADALFTADPASGYAPLDNPRLWPDAKTALAALASLPEGAVSLSRKTAKGSTLAESLLAFLPAEPLVTGFNKKGVSLVDAMLDGEGQPSALFQRLIDRSEAKSLFTPENFSGHVGDLKRCYDFLPEDEQAKIPYNRLRAMFSAPGAGRGR